MKGDRERILDMLEAIERIEPYTDKRRECFGKDELV
jgi:hypothetical protein